MNSPHSAAGAHRHFSLLVGCFTLSGVAALVYQTAWTRQFALVFGTSELAVATVLAAYMAGLALGARVIGLLLPSIRRPVRWYALLELGIGAAALLLVPACLWATDQGLVAWFGGRAAPPASALGGATLYYLLAAFITLLVPTTLMGATLPLLVRAGVGSDAELGRRVGLLYACNTAGAVAGALLGAFWLLPALGLMRTLWSAAAINLLVFVLALQIARLAHPAAMPGMRATEGAAATAAVAAGGENAWEPLPGAGWILPLMLLSGAVSFLHEVLWTRMLSHVIGGTIQAFGIMVASFLLGIALGGALGGLLANSRRRAARVFVIAELLVALAALAAWYALDAWAGTPTSRLGKSLLGLAILLPMTVAIGVTFPLATRVLAPSAGEAASASARVYSWNTAGAILGALGGGFWLIPALRYEGTLWLTVLASLSLALLGLLAMQRRQWRWSSAVALALLLALLFARPAVPQLLLRVSSLRPLTDTTLQYYAVGRSADVVVLRSDNVLDLRTNGLPEAGITVLGAPPVAYVEAWMAPLAVLARPNIRDMLVVGFGGGNVLSAVPPSVENMDVIELEPRVLDANRAIGSLRAVDPLRDTRLHFIMNDARSALALTRRKYDAIISQPSHPWTAGASHLYTREYIQQAREHLNEGGVFVEWMSLGFVDESLLRSLVGTLASVFREVRVYRPSTSTLLFMASDEPLQPEIDRQATQRIIDRSRRHYANLGINVPEDLMAALLLDTAAARRLAGDAPPITDDDNRLATANTYVRGLGLTPASFGQIIGSYDVLTDPRSFYWTQPNEDIAFDYICRRVLGWGADDPRAVQRIDELAQRLGAGPRAALLRYLVAMRLGYTARAAQILQEARARWPDDQSLRYVQAKLELAAELAAHPGERPRLLPGLRGEAALVLEGSRDAALQNWDALAARDHSLAQVDWRRIWAPEAAQLRAQWRARVLNPEFRDRYGNEGIAIADRVIVSQPDVFWQALRAQSAVGTGRPEVILESVAEFCNLARDILPTLASDERDRMLKKAQDMVALMRTLRVGPTVGAARLAQIRERLRSVLAELRA